MPNQLMLFDTKYRGARISVLADKVMDPVEILRSAILASIVGRTKPP